MYLYVQKNYGRELLKSIELVWQSFEKHVTFVSFPSKRMSLEFSELQSKANILGGPVTNERETRFSNYRHIGFLEEPDIFFFLIVQ